MSADIPTPRAHAIDEEGIKGCPLCGTEIAPDESICDGCETEAAIAQTEADDER